MSRITILLTTLALTIALSILGGMALAQENGKGAEEPPPAAEPPAPAPEPPPPAPAPPPPAPEPPAPAPEPPAPAPEPPAPAPEPALALESPPAPAPEPPPAPAPEPLPAQTNDIAASTPQQAPLPVTQLQEQPTGNLSLPSLSADNNSSATDQQVSLPQGVPQETAQQLNGLAGVVDDSAQLSNLARSINNPEDLATLGNLTQSLNSDEAGDLLGVLGDLDRENQVALLDLAELLGPEALADLLNSSELTELLDELDDEGKAELLDRLNNNFVGDEEELEDVLRELRDLLALRNFFDVGDLNDDRLEALLDFFDVFDLDELDEDELEDLLRLLRFFDLDDLDELLERIEDFDREFDIDDIESGDVNPSVDIRNTGDNVNLCLGISQAANSGNVVNRQGIDQYQSGLGDDGDGFFGFDDEDHRFGFFDDGFDFDRRDGDIEFEGSSIEIDSEVDVDCQQTIIQTAAAGAAPSLVRPVAVAPAAPVPAAAAAAPRAAVTAATSVGGAPAAVGLVARPPAQLPRTGGLTIPLAVLGLAGVGAGLALLRYRHQQR